MRYLLVFIFLLFANYSKLSADYIKAAIVACPTIEAIKAIEPHIDKDSNQYLFKDGCLILTGNAKITVTKTIDERYLEIYIHDLNNKMYTLNKGVILEKSKGQI